MIIVTITVEDQVSLGLERFGREAGNMLDAALRDTARRYKGFVRDRYLSGGMLHRRTGKLWKDMRHGKARGKQHDFIISSQPKLANIYGHAGGADIRPKEKKWLRWATEAGGFGLTWHFSKYVHLAERPFMNASAAAYDFGGQFTRSGEAAIEKAIKRDNLDG
jgi:hypothetical protein